MSVIDYYFSVSSPWVYLGHARLMEISRRHGIEINHVPMPVPQIFAATGGLPLPKRAPARQRYRFVELQRWRERLQVPLNLRPRFSPFDPALADRTVLAIVDAGNEPDRFLNVALAGVWVKDLDLADEATLGRVLREAGHDPVRTIQAAKSARIGDIYEANARRALEAGVFGAPSYIRDGEVFWGQDRLDLLEDAVSAGRKPFTPT